MRDNQNVVSSVDQQISIFLDRAISGIDTTTEFLQSELPDFIQQLLLWHGVKSFLTAIFCWIAIAVMTRLIYKYSGPSESNSFTLTHDQEGDISPHCVSLILLIFPYIFLLGGALNLTWLQIWIAPKVWLVEYAAKLVN